MTKHQSLEGLIPPRLDTEKRSYIQTKDTENSGKTSKKSTATEEKGHRCHICNAKIRHYRNLLVHLALVHYRDELRSKYGEREWECGICKVVFDAERNLLSHLANRHSDFESRLPPKNVLELPTKSGLKGVKLKKRKLVVKKEKGSENPNPNRKFKCRECKTCCVRYPDLIVHIAMIHYRHEVIAMFTRCQCYKTFFLHHCQ